MSPFEKQLSDIKTKDDMHRWIDSLPDDVRGIILIEDCGESPIMYKHIGDITIANSLWLVESYKNWLMGNV